MLLKEETDMLRKTGMMGGSEQEERSAAFQSFRGRELEGQLPANARKTVPGGGSPARRHVQRRKTFSEQLLDKTLGGSAVLACRDPTNPENLRL